MFELKPLSEKAISSALERVERYRLLNEPDDAESICRDVLQIEPTNQDALINLILCLTDQFAEGLGQRYQDACDAASGLTSEYDKSYYKGIICERRAKAHYSRATPARGNLACDWLHDAMDHYEEAEKQRPEGNDDAILRWNTCARMVMNHPEIKPAEESSSVMELE